MQLYTHQAEQHYNDQSLKIYLDECSVNNTSLCAQLLLLLFFVFFCRYFFCSIIFYIQSCFCLYVVCTICLLDKQITINTNQLIDFLDISDFESKIIRFTEVVSLYGTLYNFKIKSGMCKSCITSQINFSHQFESIL